MAEELKDLIEKIQEEGVKAAEDRARVIEEEAGQRGNAIIAKAGKEAETIISKAKEKIARMEAGARDSLKQAGRDLLLTLKKEINATLNRIIAANVNNVLTPEELGKIIQAFIEAAKDEEKENIVILIKKDDLEKLEKALLTELKADVKKGITLKSSEDIGGGFIISYDKEKSHYDFTDKALAGYISSSIKPKLAELLNTESPAAKKPKTK